MRNFLAGMAATLCVFGALVIGYMAGGGDFGEDGGGGDNANPSQPLARATVIDVRPTREPVPTQTPAPSPAPENIAPLPDRDDCNAIYGTQFRSEKERDFFFDNCVPATQAPSGQVTSGESTQPDPPAATSNRGSWGGAGGEYLAFSTGLCQSGTVGYTISGEYTGRSFCTSHNIPGAPPFTCPPGAETKVEPARANGAVIGEVFCIIPNPGG